MTNQTAHIIQLLSKAKASYEDTLAFLMVYSRRIKPSPSNAERNIIHEKVFEEIDCLDCGNCCRTTPAIVLIKDIKRISKHLQISKKQFTRKYIMDDLTGDLVFNFSPCRFLLEDNKCSIYEVRPEACRRYPHTDEDEFVNRARWNAKNTLVCPAAFLIVKKMKEEF